MKKHKEVKSRGVLTPPGVVAYPSLFQMEKEANPEDTYAQEKYVLTLVLNDSADLSKVQGAIDEVIDAQLAPGGEWEGMPREDIALPFKDNAVKQDKGRPYDKPGVNFKMKTKFDTFRVHGPKDKETGEIPTISHLTNSDADRAGDIYNGVIGRAHIHAFSYHMTNPERPGVSLRFDGVQKLADGPRFGGGAGAAFESEDADIEGLL